MTALVDLLAAMRRHFAQGEKKGVAIASETAFVLSALQRVEGKASAPLARSVHPALGQLTALLRDNGNVLEGRLAPIVDDLPWRYGYDPRPDAPGLEHAMAWAELIGPKAPIISNEIGFGLTLIGPETHYLPHRHPAVELYNVVHGTAIWSAEGVTSAKPPGSFILHPADIVHAMKTGNETLLAIYSWSGDIVSPSVWESL